jgi:hypothetical protein
MANRQFAGSRTFRGSWTSCALATKTTKTKNQVFQLEAKKRKEE